MRYSLKEISRITGGRLVNEDRDVTCVVTDSRNNAPSGALFVALRSDINDGHKYIEQMRHRGVTSFLVDHVIVGVDNVSYVVVVDTLEAVQLLAAHHRCQFKGTVVAITGSNGKTIVKEWFAQLWDSKNGKLFRSPRSYNSQLGVALSLLMIEGDERVAFIEAGISKVGEMARLERMIKPDVGVFTNLGTAHGANFLSMDQKLFQKEILFKDAKIVIRASDGDNIDQINRETVLSIYKALQIGYKDSELKSVSMRLEVKEGVLGSTIINDSYSNDITSLAIALDFADRTPAKRRILILSDISGGDYNVVSELINAHKIDLLIGIGVQINLGDYLSEVRFFTSTNDFLEHFSTSWFSQSVVLVKGGRIFEFERIVKRLENRTHTTVLEVNLARMADNLNYYRKLTNDNVKLMAMVKACGYGSGTVEVAALLEHQNVDYLAVAYADEGMELRKGGIHMPIVVLNSDFESYQVMVENYLEPEIYSFEAMDQFIDQVVRAGVTNFPIHIKIDSGMHRLGFLESDIDELISRLNDRTEVYIASIFSHFSSSDDFLEDAFSSLQYEYYKSCADRLCASVNQRFEPLLHICNTSGIERFRDRHLDMVRLGIGLYTKTPVSSLVTKIAQVKTLTAGETVGYNRKGVITKPTTIAILPIGYADGLFRAFGNGVGRFNVNGVLCRTIGNICMDTCMVDVSGVAGVKAGDRVVIFGDNPTALDLALSIGTIEYEILTSVAPRIKRIYISE